MNAALGGVLAYLVFGILGFLRRPRLCGMLAILAGIVSLALWAPGFPKTSLGPSPWGIALAGDGLALSTWALGLLLHAAVGWHERLRPGAFHPLLTLLVGTCLALVLSQDLFNLYVALELTSLLSFLLVGYEARPAAIWASLQYLILTTVGMILYLFGLGLVYGKLGTLSLSEIAALSPELSEPALAVGVGLLLAGAAAKGGVFLFGLWLPRAHGQAPTGISALLSGLVVKTGIVALARLSQAFPVGPVLLALGVVTGLGGLVYALWEQDIKFFLAFHTVSQLGYVLIGLGLGGPAYAGAILYLVAHGLFKGLLFLGAGEAVLETGERRIPQLAGRVSLPCALALGVGSWAIVGLPPLAGFAAKGALTSEIPLAWKGLLWTLGLGTTASFAKLLPLLLPCQTKGRVGGMGLLVGAVLGLGILGLIRFPELLHPGVWGESFLVVAAGYGLHLGLRRPKPQLPRITLDRATTALLLAAVAIPLALLWTG